MSFPRAIYVQITEEELESLEAEANNGIEFREFVPVEKIDPVYFESSYYLAPSKGAEKPYRLMAETLEKTGHVGRREPHGADRSRVVDLHRPRPYHRK